MRPAQHDNKPDYIKLYIWGEHLEGYGKMFDDEEGGDEGGGDVCRQHLSLSCNEEEHDLQYEAGDHPAMGCSLASCMGDQSKSTVPP